MNYVNNYSGHLQDKKVRCMGILVHYNLVELKIYICDVVFITALT